MIEAEPTDQSQQQEPIEQQQQQRKKKRRHRPSTKGVRAELKTLIESAILDTRSDLLATAFSPVTDDGTLGAPLSAVLSHLQQLGHNTTRFSALSAIALKSVSNRTRIFRIAERDQQKDTQKRDQNNNGEELLPDLIAPVVDSKRIEAEDGAELWVLVNSRVCAHGENKTVYVDNLPPSCTAQKLHKRASLFGQVIGVHLPQIERIQRRIGQMIGGAWPAHSGFGFVQFASKTAAKRFCKRYATNSRLKRIHHHHHGHRHGKKKAMPTTTAETNELPQPQGDEDGVGTTVDEQPRGEGEGVGDMAEQEQQKVTGDNGDGQGTSMQYDIIDTTSTHPLAATSILNTSMCSLWSGETAEGSGMRIRCYSMAEESLMSESGNEMEANAWDKQQGGEAEMSGQETGQNATESSAKRKRRKRRRKMTKPLASGGHQSLNTLFRHIQVFPLKQYRELRTDYLRMKKMRMGTLKKQLMMVDGKKNLNKEEEEQPKVKDGEEEKGGKGMEEKRVRRRRKRGIGKLMGQAERLKTEAFNS